MKHGKKTLVLTAFAVVLVLVLLAGAIWTLSFERRIQEPVRLAAHTARSSAEVRDVIGEPVSVVRFTKGSLSAKGCNGNADLTIQVYGPRGRGTLLEWAQEDAGKWHLCSLLFRSTDTSVSTSLVSDTSTHCDRE